MPYKFLDSDKFESQLINLLNKQGYEFIERVKLYREECIEFKRIWDTSETLSITWKREFVADGMNEEDIQVIIKKNQNEIGKIDVRRLLQSKLEYSLNMEILHRITEIIENE